MDKTADKLVGYASKLRYSDLTPSAIHSAKRSLIDSIGCALGAFSAEPLVAIRRLAAQVSSTRPVTIIGTTQQSAPDMAAFTNGAMIRYLDFSDDYFGGSGDIGPHPSDNIGGVLAATEAAGADGRSLLLGTVLAYEACGQLVDTVKLRGATRTWDYPIFHAIATSLGAAKVMGLSDEQMRAALSLAVVPNVPLLQTRSGELSNWKGFAGPNASRNGLFAAMLAREGITGPDEPFEGKAGLARHLNMPLEFGDFDSGRFKIEETFYKYIPIRYSAQLPVWVALEARERVAIDDIESICVYMVKRYVTSREEEPEHWNPTTRETTDHSFPYLIGAALVDGAITERTFTPERFRDPAILGVVQKVRFAEDKAYSAAFPRASNCRFEITLKSGKTVSVHQKNPRGHPANPMSDHEIEDKFLRQADAASMSRSQSRLLLDRLWAVETEPAMKDLLSATRLPSI